MKGVHNSRVTIAIVLLACQLVLTRSQSQIDASPKTGRAISSSNQGSQNNVHKTDIVTYEEEDDDSVAVVAELTNRNSETHNQQITFPGDNVLSYQKIPLTSLVKFGKEVDVSSFLRKFVTNAKVYTNENTLEEYLVYPNDTKIPFKNSRNETVIVTPPKKMHTLQSGYGIQGRVNTLGLGQGRSSINNADQSVHTRLAATNKQRQITYPQCTPEKISVPVPITQEPHLFFIPRCARVERCGGCCLSEIMACEPDAKEFVEIRVHKLGYLGDDQFKFIDDEVYKLEKHNSCSCKCKTKAEHCLPHHTYDESQCSCVCKNTDDFRHCESNPKKVWDEQNCMCVCREIKDCSSGYYYDLTTCDCVLVEDILLRSKPSGSKRVLARRAF